MNKKVLLIILCGMLLFGVTGCGSDSEIDGDTVTIQDDNKINLNDNIEITLNTKSTGGKDCFFYMFATNLDEVFPNAKIDSYNNYHSVHYWIGPSIYAAEDEITEEGLTDNINSLQFNTDQESAIVNLLQEYQNNVYEGVKSVEYTLEDHRLTFSYDYLVFKNNDYKSDGETLDSKVQEILVDATKFIGACGGFDFDKDTILTEELCDEYNLICDRW